MTEQGKIKARNERAMDACRNYKTCELSDLREAVDVAGEPFDGRGSVAPVYGMAATFGARGLVGEMLERYVDRLYDV